MLLNIHWIKNQYDKKSAEEDVRDAFAGPTMDYNNEKFGYMIFGQYLPTILNNYILKHVEYPNIFSADDLKSLLQPMLSKNYKARSSAKKIRKQLERLNNRGKFNLQPLRFQPSVQNLFAPFNNS
jgi:hypothetical protein